MDSIVEGQKFSFTSDCFSCLKWGNIQLRQLQSNSFFSCNVLLVDGSLSVTVLCGSSTAKSGGRAGDSFAELFTSTSGLRVGCLAEVLLSFMQIGGGRRHEKMIESRLYPSLRAFKTWLLLFSGEERGAPGCRIPLHSSPTLAIVAPLCHNPE